MFHISHSTWLPADATVRRGQVDGHHYLTIESEPGTGELSMWFGDYAPDAAPAALVELIDRLASQLQDIRADLLRAAVDADQMTEGTHLAGMNDADAPLLRTHLFRDHGVAIDAETLAETPAASLAARHRREHTAGVAGPRLVSGPDDDPDEPDDEPDLVSAH